MGHQSYVYVVKSPFIGLQRAPKNSELAPSVLVLSAYCYFSWKIDNFKLKKCQNEKSLLLWMSVSLKSSTILNLYFYIGRH